ncbi:MAG: type II toxin-antitoxin system VapC family toxin [Ignavibacteriota bacterium]|nr:MAG: type II toxin-antitoxin system VapC family toxin [Chlorobiota bacterium]MBE7476492.1 type II toxin-antitoxin system VapC family toxin [Ignavibacteriales bacterium]MBL1123627.1 type II toxin-antitoxin system VapC family toxin [Ignavibacteriota bacterium]MCC7094475.1 type II toxin-antitoxin system VapC family toxin [Ignavibacteriaceae bacterium]MCE7855516.1 type II toxin-antitoxin system VapC family toxin [Ignavibacteria bacterium CHB3]MEB2296354.1 type II toxin-antitoxin system VapC fam
MECLLDTNALLWIVTDDVQLSKKARKIFLDEENEIFISVASLWEIAIKVSLKRLNLGQTLNEFYIRHIVGNKIRLMDIKVEHLAELEYLEFHHRDPFDRLIISQAIVEKIHVLSKDKVLSKYPIKRIW